VEKFSGKCEIQQLANSNWQLAKGVTGNAVAPLPIREKANTSIELQVHGQHPLNGGAFLALNKLRCHRTKSPLFLA
jgi:hypothetical protein